MRGGNYRGYLGIADNYRYGRGVDIDKLMAIEIYMKAINNNIAEAYALVGDTYLEVGDTKKAVEYYSIGIENGDPHCYGRMGDLVMSEYKGKRKNIRSKREDIRICDRAIELYCMSEKLGMPQNKTKRYEAIEKRYAILGI
jgi:TPR repeat protein